MALLFDIETDGLLDEMTKIHCLVIKHTESDIVRRFVGHEEIRVALGAYIQTEPLIVGHNVLKFDIPAIQKLHPWFKPKGQIRDTLTLSRLIWSDLKERDFERVSKGSDFPKNLIGQHGLKAWGYRLGCLKGEFGQETDWKEFSPEMLAYCVQDVEVLHKLWDRIQQEQYSERAIELEHEFQKVLWLQEQHGFAFDRKAAVDLYSTLGQRRAELEKELKAMCPGWYTTLKIADHWRAYLPEDPEGGWTDGAKAATLAFAKKRLGERGLKHRAKELVLEAVPKIRHVEFNPSSRDHIARVLIERHGWKPKQFTPEGRPTVDETVLEGLPYPEAKLLGEYFLIEKRIGQLAEGQNAWLRLEREGRIHGEVCTNGAVTGRCTHQRPNVAQTPGCAAPYGRECRSLFIASPGYSLVGCDASGLELRCLAHYMARYDGGAYAKELISGDIHTANQKAAGLESRGQAKTMIYGLLYGAGDAKMGLIIGRGAREGKALRERFLSKTPALKRLRDDVIAAAKKRGYLIGLDGRRLPIRSEHSALNTLLQSAGALIVKEATVVLHNDLVAKGWEFGREWAQVAHIHDEIDAEVKQGLEEEYGNAAVGAMREAGRRFEFRCPIDAEYKKGRTWAECH
jgi:DNA polymerase I-like protein with 3'-5' exonuclease and polymerase domains